MKLQKNRKMIMYALTAVFALIVLGGAVALLRFFNTDLFLPPGTDAVIQVVLNEELPEFVTGETGYADSNGVKIWYEVLCNTDTPKGTVLLIRGYTRSALNWKPSFYEPMLAAGYQVIRFDNRDVGMSDWITDWDEATTYTLSNMAQDALAVLDTVGVEQAHLIGISMGGGIAQEMAIQYPERVLTLTLIATSADRHDPEFIDTSGRFSQNLKTVALRYGLFKDIENQLRLRVAVEEAVRGDADYTVDVKQTVQIALYEIRQRQGFNPAVSEHQMAAINASKARHEGLQTLQHPTLVVHGSADCLSSRAGAEELAEIIPNAETLWLEGMGHDVVEPYTGQIVSGFFTLIGETSEGVNNNESNTH